jgi:hypothetical protein
MREHCADAALVSHEQCEAAVAAAGANCRASHILRYRAENCAQWKSSGGLISVLDLGGINDGHADNIEAIERAVNATRICGGSVSFPTGRL